MTYRSQRAHDRSRRMLSTLGGWQRSEKRRVGIKHSKIVVRPFFEPVKGADVVGVIRAPAELIQTPANSALKIRDHCTHVMGDNFQVGILVKNPRQRKSTHRHTGLIRPA